MATDTSVGLSLFWLVVLGLFMAGTWVIAHWMSGFVDRRGTRSSEGSSAWSDPGNLSRSASEQLERDYALGRITEEELEQAQLLDETPVRRDTRAQAPHAVRTLTPQGLRNQLIWMEILQPPLALRDERR